MKIITKRMISYQARRLTDPRKPEESPWSAVYPPNGEFSYSTKTEALENGLIDLCETWHRDDDPRVQNSGTGGIVVAKMEVTYLKPTQWEKSKLIKRLEREGY